jgi:hypothetical protein
VKVINILRDEFALEILPGAATDPITCVDDFLAISSLCAQVRPPRLVTGASALRQFLAIAISAFDTAQVTALAWPNAGNEKRHVRRLRWRLLGLCLSSGRCGKSGDQYCDANSSEGFHPDLLYTNVSLGQKILARV